MKTLEFLYQETKIHFLINPSDNNVMVNATEMAQLFNKRVDHFTKSDHAKAFIKVMEEKLIHTPNGGRIIEKRGRNGVYFDRRLALKFAAWLDPKFEVWVFSTIDQILLGHYKEQREATAEKIRAEQQLELKKKELVEKYPEFVDFLALEGKVSEADKRRLKAIRASVQQLKLDLFPEVYS